MLKITKNYKSYYSFITESPVACFHFFSFGRFSFHFAEFAGILSHFWLQFPLRPDISPWPVLPCLSEILRNPNCFSGLFVVVLG